jgi:hypothetical protein
MDQPFFHFAEHQIQYIKKQKEDKLKQIKIESIKVEHKTN